MHDVNWESVFSKCYTCDDLVSGFYNVLDRCIELYVPVSSCKVGKSKRKYPPKLRKLNRKKCSLWKKVKRFNTPAIKSKYIKACKDFRIAAAEAEEKFEESLVKSCNLGRFFRYANSKFTGRRNVTSLRDDMGVLTSDPQEKAELLSTRFSENFTLDDNKDSILGSRSNIGCLDNVIFSPGAIKKVISKLKINSAAGPDYIPPVFLKKCSDFLVHPLSYLFYECFEQFFYRVRGSRLS